jgi:CRISPR-associated protein Csx14
MSNPTPSIVVAVDPTNPGQFFACCGLLELADRLWPGAEGWFAQEGGDFCVASEGTLQKVLDFLITTSPREVLKVESNGLEVRPIVAMLAFSFDGGKTEGLLLDTWTRIVIRKGAAQVEGQPPWNFWSGQQTSLGIWNGLRAALTEQLMSVDLSNSTDPFSHCLFQGGRFGFDCGPAWNALDVGFSPNEQGMEVESSPLVELLAAIGLQRFRPVMNDDRDGFDYFTWHHPFSPSVAATAMAGAIREKITQRFRASVVSRGQYAALSKAFSLTTGDSDE